MNKLLLSIGLLAGTVFAQGVYNNGARIVTNGPVFINITGGAAGAYRNEGNGLITTNSGTPTMMVQGNWTNNSTTNNAFSNNGTIVQLTGANQTIGGTRMTRFHNLQLLGTGTKTLNVRTTVGGFTPFDGVLALGTRPLDLNSNILRVENSGGGAITTTTGYIISETNLAVNPSIVRWRVSTTTGAHVVPYGTVSGVQIPFTFNITTPMTGANDSIDFSTRPTAAADNVPWAGASNVGPVLAMYSPIIGGPGAIPVVIDRWWDITPRNSTPTATVTFSYRGIENTLTAPYNTGNLGAQHWNGATWDAPVGSNPAVLVGVGSVTAPGLNSFSPFVLSSILAPLPVELGTFEAHCTNTNVLISWNTLTETNSDYFIVQRSEDMTAWEDIAIIDAAGYSNTTLNYSYVDNRILTTTSYYRLRQVDLNNTARNYDPIVVEPCSSMNDFIDVYNGQTDIVTIAINAQTQSVYNAQIIDMNGKVMDVRQLQVGNGYNEFKADMSSAAAGIYVVSLFNENTSFAKKIYIHNTK